MFRIILGLTIFIGSHFFIPWTLPYAVGVIVGMLFVCLMISAGSDYDKIHRAAHQAWVNHYASERGVIDARIRLEELRAANRQANRPLRVVREIDL
jgi:hypothetical protein